MNSNNLKERIKYALDKGIPLGVVVFVIFGLFQLGKSTMSEVYFSLPALKRLGLYLLGAVLGYFFFGWWADKDKRNKDI